MVKTLSIYFFFILLPFKLCLASYEEQEYAEAQPVYKRLRVDSVQVQPTLLFHNQWDTLPVEVFIACLECLSFKELASVKLVCKRWATVAKDETLSIKYHFLNSSYACLLRKIDQSQEVQEYVKTEIGKYVMQRKFIRQF
ncbi:MAG: F-box protein [Alphaproteobacteria bacterium]|nr:F-box protein [Alphaproteobacteria bacterium]